jgi:metal-responsive CopG/Arc/MetJ family transcriptional regulator
MRRRQEWVTVKIPRSLALKLDGWVEEHAELGLKSRSDAVCLAIRELIRWGLKENTNPYEF